MKYLNKSFSVGTENSAAYRDNYDRIFRKKSKPEKQPEIERCHECGSWEAQCSAPGPVPGCACARCLLAELREADAKLECQVDGIPPCHGPGKQDYDLCRACLLSRCRRTERERDEARALLQAATDNAFDAGAKAQGLEDAHVAVRLRKQLRECVRVIEGMLPPGDESVGIPEFPPVSPGDAWECVLRTRELLKGCGA